MDTKLTTTTDKPWLPRPGEGEAAYLHFKTWLMSAWNQPKPGVRHKGEVKRSARETAKFLGLTLNTVEAEHSRNQWASRARAYDAHIMAMHASGALADLDDMRARQNRLLNTGMFVLEASLDRLKTTLEGNNAKALSAVKLDVPRLMDTILKYQNLLYGQSTANVAATVEFGTEWDLSDLSLEELRFLSSIRAKVKRRET